MKKTLVVALIFIFLAGIGGSVFVYFYPTAHENWEQPTTTALMVEPEENYMKLEKEGLVMIVRDLAVVYDNHKKSSNARIYELKSTLMTLIIMLSISVVFIFYLIIQSKKHHVTRI